MKTDIKESETGYDLAVELPGYKKEDMKLELKDGCLTISAEIKHDNDEKDEKGNFIRRERYYGKSSRSFYVGEEVTEEDIKAKYEDGILKISVPKKEAKPVVDEAKYIAIEG
jgi:HSP20 family molecular chaperone IbpA